MHNYQQTNLFFTNKIMQYSDEELLSLFRNTGKHDYYTALYSRYIPLIYGLCLNYLKTKEEAQDTVMELFADVQEKALQYEIKTFRTWIYSVAKNHCLKVLRDNKEVISVEINPQFMELADFPTLFNESNKEENFRLLQRCLDQLPEPQQKSIRLFFMDDQSYADIAAVTGYHLKSVKSYIQNGKRNLKICMENEE